MAYDKVVDSAVLDAGLTSIADAIRTKGGTSSTMSFPDGMASAIAAIPTGGGGSDELITFIKGVIDRTTTATQFPSELSGITSIGDYAFAFCPSLGLTSLPSGVTSLGTCAFRGCFKMVLTSLPSGLNTIAMYAFDSCKSLALTSIPSSVTSIGNSAFSNCAALKTLTFEGTPKSIGSNAFSNCSNLKTINVPWASGAVSGAPWGATNATINYNYTA